MRNNGLEADSTNALVQAAIDGDGSAIQTLWEANRRWIAAVLLAHKPNFMDLEDLLQEVAMTFVSKVHTLREEANLRAWLRTVAINAARSAARSGKARPNAPLSENGHECSSLHADGRVAVCEEAQHVFGLASELPESYREPLMLRAVKGLRSREISEILNIPEATVDTRVARARRMLRELVEERAGMAGCRDEESHLGGAR